MVLKMCSGFWAFQFGDINFNLKIGMFYVHAINWSKNLRRHEVLNLSLPAM